MVGFEREQISGDGSFASQVPSPFLLFRSPPTFSHTEWWVRKGPRTGHSVLMLAFDTFQKDLGIKKANDASSTADGATSHTTSFSGFGLTEAVQHVDLRDMDKFNGSCEEPDSRVSACGVEEGGTDSQRPSIAQPGQRIWSHLGIRKLRAKKIHDSTRQYTCVHCAATCESAAGSFRPRPPNLASHLGRRP